MRAALAPIQPRCSHLTDTLPAGPVTVAVQAHQMQSWSVRLLQSFFLAVQARRAISLEPVVLAARQAQARRTASKWCTCRGGPWTRTT